MPLPTLPIHAIINALCKPPPIIYLELQSDYQLGCAAGMSGRAVLRLFFDPVDESYSSPGRWQFWSKIADVLVSTASVH